MKTKGILAGAILLWLPFSTMAQDTVVSSHIHNFSAQQAVEYALKNAVPVKNALLDIQRQYQVNREVTAAALPQLSASASATYNPNVAVQTIPDFISRSTYGVLINNKVQNGNTGQPIEAPSDFGFLNIGFGAKYAGNGSVMLNQLLFDGQVFVGLQARSAAIRNATLQAEVTNEQIKANVFKIYYQIVVGKKQIGTLDANIANYQKLLHDTREIFKNGFAEKLDVDKVQVQLNNIETQKLKAQNQIDAGIEGLKFYINLPQQDQLILTDTLSDEELMNNLVNDDYRYEDRKEYQQLETAITLNKYNVKRYQLSRIPTVSLNANYGYNGQWQTFDYFKGPYYKSSFVALRFNIPIFDGGARSARIAQARIDVQKLNNNLGQLRSSIDNDVMQSRINMKSALLTMQSQKNNIALAQQVYNSTKLKYEQGLGSNQEISTAQADLVTAQNNYFNSLYDAIIAKIDYLKAAGKL